MLFDMHDGFSMAPLPYPVLISEQSLGIVP